MNLENPISKHARSVVYLCGLVISALVAGIGAPVIAILNLGHWSPILVGVVGVIGTVTNILARANLGTPEDPVNPPHTVT